jgi:hypothetical protein
MTETRLTFSANFEIILAQSSFLAASKFSLTINGKVTKNIFAYGVLFGILRNFLSLLFFSST